MEVTVHKNVMNAENKIFDYTSVPPPPYTKSSVGSSSSFNTFNRPKQAIKLKEALSLSLKSVSNVKDYISRLKNMSPVYVLKREGISMHKRNISRTTDIYTENTKSNINNFNTSSPSPFTEQNNSSSESNTMNDSLERIGTSLQLLIEEAQASLLTTSGAQQHQQSEAENIVDYSYRYVQHNYIQSQEKITLAIEKLEQSIHNIFYTASTQRQAIQNHYTTHHHYHHYYAAKFSSSTSSPPSPLPPLVPLFSRNKLWIIGIFLLFISYSMQPYYKIRYAKTSILLLLLTKKSHTFKKIITLIDRLVIHLVQSRHLPLIKFTHRFNMAICVTKLLFLQ